MKGRKRHIVVDTLGLPLAVAVHPADIQDRDGARLVLARLLGRFPRLQLIWADGAYGGKFVEWARTVGGWTLELVRRPAQQHTFQVLPRRWVVERTFGWLNLQRRLSKDYEALCETTETWIYIAMTGLTLRRLACLPHFRHPLRPGIRPELLGLACPSNWAIRFSNRSMIACCRTIMAIRTSRSAVLRSISPSMPTI